MRKRWPVRLARSLRLYESRLVMRLDPEILCVLYRSDGPRVMALSTERVAALERKLRDRLRRMGLAVKGEVQTSAAPTA